MQAKHNCKNVCGTTSSHDVYTHAGQQPALHGQPKKGRHDHKHVTGAAVLQGPTHGQPVINYACTHMCRPCPQRTITHVTVYVYHHACDVCSYFWACRVLCLSSRGQASVARVI